MNEIDTVTYQKEQILKVLRDLEVLVVSSDRIGSAWQDRDSDEKYNAMFVKFFDEFGFFKKLAKMREILSEPFPYESDDNAVDELERNFQSLKFWSPPVR
jgi:hypothetical protein